MHAISMIIRLTCSACYQHVICVAACSHTVARVLLDRYEGPQFQSGTPRRRAWRAQAYSSSFMVFHVKWHQGIVANLRDRAAWYRCAGAGGLLTTSAPLALMGSITVCSPDGRPFLAKSDWVCVCRHGCSQARPPSCACPLVSLAQGRLRLCDPGAAEVHTAACGLAAGCRILLHGVRGHSRRRAGGAVHAGLDQRACEQCSHRHMRHSCLQVLI